MEVCLHNKSFVVGKTLINWLSVYCAQRKMSVYISLYIPSSFFSEKLSSNSEDITCRRHYPQTKVSKQNKSYDSRNLHIFQNLKLYNLF